MSWCKGTAGNAGWPYFELVATIDPFGLIRRERQPLDHGLVFPGNPSTPCGPHVQGPRGVPSFALVAVLPTLTG